METYKPKSNEELCDKFIPHDELWSSLEFGMLCYRQAESELLPLLNKSEERVRELSDELSKAQEHNSSFATAHQEMLDKIRNYQLANSNIKHRHEAMLAELKVKIEKRYSPNTGSSDIHYDQNGDLLWYWDIQSIINKYEKL